MVAPMNRNLAGLALLSFASLLPLIAAPKIATAHFQDIYNARPEVKSALAKADRAREEILLDPRAEELRSGLDALKEIQARIQAATRRSANDEARKLAQEFEIKRLETKALQGDFESYRAKEEKDINLKLVKQMRASIDEISQLIQETARSMGYEVIMDLSAISNTGIPLLLYVKDAPDITKDLMALLEKKDAAQAAPDTDASSNETTGTPPQD